MRTRNEEEKNITGAIEAVREKMSDPDNVVLRADNLSEPPGASRGQAVRRCVVGWCFALSTTFGAPSGTAVVNAIEEHNPYPSVTEALRAGEHLTVLDKAIAARRAA